MKAAPIIFWYWGVMAAIGWFSVRVALGEVDIWPIVVAFVTGAVAAAVYSAARSELRRIW